MTSRLSALFLFISVSFFSSVIFAADNPLQWTEATLIKTLTIDYKNYKESLKLSRKNFTAEAWSQMDSFLGNYSINILNEQLSLHPKLVQQGRIVDSGNISNTDYWRINLIITLPELMVTYKFSVVVVQPANSPYVIQSVNVNRL